MTRDGAKYGKEKETSSPADLPGRGMSRAVSGFLNRTERPATSSMIAASTRDSMSPGSGTQSRPVPQTALYESSLSTVRMPSAALWAIPASSSTGYMSPENPASVPTALMVSARNAE